MAAARVCWGWIEAGWVGLAGLYGFGEGVVDLDDGAPGAVVAVESFLVLAASDGEGVHNVGHDIAGCGEQLCQGGGSMLPFLTWLR